MPPYALIGPIGPLEIGIVLLIVLIIWGPKRLPELGKSLGQGMRGFKDSVTGKDSEEPERIEAGKVDASGPAQDDRPAESAGAPSRPTGDQAA
jgi:sec-independent protein translocase protein TatA